MVTNHTETLAIAQNSTERHMLSIHPSSTLDLHRHPDLIASGPPFPSDRKGPHLKATEPTK